MTWRGLRRRWTANLVDDIDAQIEELEERIAALRDRRASFARKLTSR